MSRWEGEKIIKRILMIDDESALVDAICDNFEMNEFFDKNEYQFLKAYDGVEGIRKIIEYKPVYNHGIDLTVLVLAKKTA